MGTTTIDLYRLLSVLDGEKKKQEEDYHKCETDLGRDFAAGAYHGMKFAIEALRAEVAKAAAEAKEEVEDGSK